MMRWISLFIVITYTLVAGASVTVTVNGTSHTIPEVREKGWGENVTAWIQDISADTLQPTGGTFTLTADVDFGATYGLESVYFKSRTNNEASSGVLRLANTDTIKWRNGANGGDLTLGISSDALQFEGVDLLTDSAGLSALTTAEVDQLENIGSSTISATQWGYLGGMDQSVATTDNVTFNNIAGTLTTAAQGNVTSLGTLTALDVDNLNLDGNTISSTDTNGNIVLTPDGTGNVQVSSEIEAATGGGASTPSYSFASDTDTGVYRAGADTLGIATGGTSQYTVDSNGTHTFNSTQSDALIINSTSLTPTLRYNNNSGVVRSRLQYNVSNDYFSIQPQLSESVRINKDYLDLRAVGSSPNEIRIGDADNSTYVGWTAPATVNSTYVLSLPDDPPSAGQVLVAGASNTLDWGSNGSSSGGINYISNSDAEFNTTGYATYDDGAVASPVDGTGGTSSNVTIGRTTTSSEILRGSASFEIAKGAADAQGEGVSYDFEIDEADQGKEIFVSFDYKTSSNYASDDIQVFVYDRGNSSLIGALTNDDDGAIVAESGDGNKFTATFYADDASTTYRLIFHVTTTNASAYDLFFDNIKVGPDSPVPGAIVTEWQEFAPSGALSTNVGYQGEWRRVGDTMEIQIRVAVSGATNSANPISFNIPSGYTIDTSKLPSTGSSALGIARAVDDNTTGHNGVVIYNSPTSVRVTPDNSGSVWNSSTNVPFTWETDDTAELIFAVPIVGWSSGASFSTTETFVRSAKVRLTKSTSQSAINTGTQTDVTFDGTDFDVTGIADLSNDQIEIKAPGFYRVTASSRWDGLDTADTRVLLFISAGGTTYTYSSSGNASGDGGVFASVLVELDAGDTISMDVQQDGGGAADLLSATYLEAEAMPDFSTFSVWGETEYEEVILSSDTSTSTSNTYVDVTGASLTLSPGTWVIGYSVTLTLQEASGSGQFCAGDIAITDASNNVIDGSVANVGGILAANASIFWPVSKQTEITIASETTYKLRIRSEGAAASETLTARSDNYNGILSNPDNDSVFWARRVK